MSAEYSPTEWPIVYRQILLILNPDSDSRALMAAIEAVTIAGCANSVLQSTS